MHESTKKKVQEEKEKNDAQPGADITHYKEFKTLKSMLDA
jgi:hypothetical protein